MGVLVTPTSLNESARKYRKALLIAVSIGLGHSLKHMTVRPGIRFEETVGELDGSFELKPNLGAFPAGLSDATIKGRTLKTYQGQVYELFHLQNLISTIYGLDMTAQKKSDKFDINKKLLFLIVKRISAKLNQNLFSAVRDDAGTTTAKLFDGFDTITAAEIVLTNIAAGKGNYQEIVAIDDTNAVDILQSIFEGSSDELQFEKSKMFITAAQYNSYLKDYKVTTGATPYNTEYKKLYLEGSNDNCELVPLISKKTSPYIHLTTKANTLIGVDQMSDLEKVRIKEDNNVNYTQFIMDMFFGTQFDTLSKEKFMTAKIV
ncbi:MAG: hypothetical protein QM503_10675 [Bacteroidota bacterium]